MIIAAAIKIGDVVTFIPAPARHHDVLRGLKDNFKGRTDQGYLCETQGFLTSSGLFLNRSEAYEHALACGQGLPRRKAILAEGYQAYNGTELFSEDLW